MPFKDPQKAREYQRRYQFQWHQDNKTERLAANYLRKAEIYQYVQSIKTTVACCDCGARHPAVLQFHHRNREEKLFNISDAIKNKYSLEKVIAEIRKCILLCANCHAIRHWRETHRSPRSTEPNLAEQFETAQEHLIPTPQETAAYEAIFGTSGNVDEEYAAYQEYYGVDPQARK